MTAATRPRRPRRRRARGQRGIALLAVITAVAICLVIVNEFGTRTTIDMMQARNNLDQMRAHFLAQSSLNISDVVLRLQHQLDENAKNGPMAEQLKGVQITDFADALMAAFGGDAEQVRGAVGPLADTSKGLGADIGTFGVRMTPVDGKINVNCAADSNMRDVTGMALLSLLYPTAFDPLFEEPDAEGWRRNRETQVGAIIDYIDSDSYKVEYRPKTDRQPARWETTSAAEAYGYEDLRDTYKPKNDRIDSVAELRLVRGVDDRFWTLFGKAFRHYGRCKVNLRALDDVHVVMSLLSGAPADENDPIVQNPAWLFAMANLVIQAKQFGVVFMTNDEFMSFVKDPLGELQGVLGTSAPGTMPTGTPSLPPVPWPSSIKGLELDRAKLANIAETTEVQTYEVEAWSEINRPPFLPIRRTIHAVWDQKFRFSNSRSPLLQNGGGTWLYLREE
ncbi:MAG TPA: hypothetical protein VM734_00860 [Kofleriaceae bacterium]|nr:hypothetical protein [Kofleriaceae bacterium]